MSIFAFLKNIFKKEKMKKINEELYVGGQISADDVKILNDNGIKTTRGKNFSYGLVWILRKKYYKSKLRRQNNPNGKIINKRVIEE